MCTIPDHETGGHLQLILTYCWPSTSWQHACSRVFEPRKKLSSVDVAQLLLCELQQRMVQLMRMTRQQQRAGG